MSKCQFSMLGMTFFLAIFINKKYPAGRLPDILWCKLHFERLLLLSDCKLNKVIDLLSAPPTSSFPIRNRLSGAPACDRRFPFPRLQFFARAPFLRPER